MSIKVKDIVVNITSSERVGQYVEEFDVRIIPEMLPGEVKIAEVMYIDEDGAIITKELGPYAFPADCLRLATEEEKAEYEVAKYTFKVDYKGESKALDIKIGKLIVENGVTIGKDNSEANESICRLVEDCWDTQLRGKDRLEDRALLAYECYNVARRRVESGRGISRLINIIKLVYKSKNNDLIADFVENMFENPVKDKDFYRSLEENDIVIPEQYAEIVKDKSGYICGHLIEGLDLLDYLKSNRSYDYYFRHYNKLKITKEGLDYLVDLEWNRSDLKNVLREFDMSMDLVKHFLMNPNRNFSIDMSMWFVNLPWDEILEHKDMFADCFKSEWKLCDRVKRGKYIAPEYLVKVLSHNGTSDELINYSSQVTKNKTELKLKDVIAHLASLDEEATQK